MKKLFYSAILLVGMLLNVSVNAQTSILPLSSDDLFKAYDNYQKGIYAKAYEIFKSLSDNGDAQGAYGLGVCYYNGRGTTTNLQEAFNCFNKSYNRGNKSAAFIIGKCYFYGQGVERDLEEASKFLTEASNKGNMEAEALLSTIFFYVDLGLPSGTKWANCNVGAKNPEDYGDYFAWGETVTKSNYDWSTYKYANGAEDKLTKYCNEPDYGNNGFTDSRTTLERTDDAATVNWGSDWCMPTKAQFQELKDKCTWTWTTIHGKDGYEVKGPNGKTIFLPAAGYRSGTSLYYDGSSGYYWSSSLRTSYQFNGRYRYFDSGSVIPDYWYGRDSGFSVRPVRCR